MLAIINWNGQGDGQSWGDVNNWVGKVLPGAQDDVVIDVANNPTVVFSTGNVSVASLTSAESFSITGGTFTVTGDSVVNGAFAMTGGTLVANGTGVDFTSNSTTTVSGSSLSALSGGAIHLPNLTSYTNTTSVNDQTRTLKASGAGSHLDLPNVNTITNGLNFNTHLAIQALSGGTVDLNGVTQITEPNSGDLRFRSINILADGTGTPPLPCPEGAATCQPRAERSGAAAQRRPG
jgi:hypothetical protein